MKKEIVNVGVIGTGMMGRAFTQIISQLPDAELVGVSDIAEASGQAVAKEYGVPYYKDYEDMIARPEVQAVIVTTPEGAHVGPSVAALERGKAVLVEKPIADTISGALKMMDAAKRTGAVLLVGHVIRFNTHWATAKQAIDDGKIGAVQYIVTRALNGKSAQDRLKGRCSLPHFLGVHHYDFVRWVAASEPVRVYAESQFNVLKPMGHDVEDSTIATFTFANGVVAVCETGWILPAGHPSRSDHRAWVQGTDGRLELELLNAGFMVTNAENTAYTGVWFMPRVRGEIQGAFVYEVQHFLDCIREHKEPLITAHDALVALKMAEATTESARTHQVVHM